MMISIIFLLFLMYILYGPYMIYAGLLNNTIPKVEVTQEQQLDAINLPNIFQHKLDTFTNALNQIDASVQALQEKAHNWAIFRHHIDAWNEQLKSFEHKLDLIKRSQEEQQNLSNKLTSLEFTLNHILSKVVFLSDTCNTKLLRADNYHDFKDQSNFFENLQTSLNADNRLKSDISLRLNNILRHVQNIENDNCHSNLRVKQFKKASTDKVADINGNYTNGMQRSNWERSLKRLEQNIEAISTHMSQKDFKQFQALTRKNAKTLEQILAYVNSSEDRFEEWKQKNTKSMNQLTKNCCSISSELSTFTESSDLLLKRIEAIVDEIKNNIKSHTHIKFPKSKPSATTDDDSHEPEENENQDEDWTTEETDDGDYTGQEGNEENHVQHEYNEEDEVTLTTREDDYVIKAEQKIESSEFKGFIQPDKYSCDQLTEPVDGVYQFATVDSNKNGRNFNKRFCYFATDGRAWTVIQNRVSYDNSENFNRSWVDYRAGFGSLFGNFWFGNEFIYRLCDSCDCELRIEIEDFKNDNIWAELKKFILQSEDSHYRLVISGYNGTYSKLGNELFEYENNEFQTYDRCNNGTPNECCSCAIVYGIGWWFDNCCQPNIMEVPRIFSQKKMRMMIRPKY
ncbi:angiopoietin-1-like [Teleopsis dalmanni]|uniref:angiopoietin-1-like n=1 Tax=Teleopsis dalmanni TaxID=139649 RepID=UPI0018CFBBB9|nr:angiopoietin-1-like [Teleopsis dalmanni]